MNSVRWKLFVDAHCFDKEFQGSRTFVKELYAVLVQKKDIQFYFAAFDVDRLKQSIPSGDNIVFLKYRSRSPLYRLTIDIPRLISQHNIDIAHFQYFSPLVKNCKQILTVHDVLFCDYPSEFSLLYRLSRKLLVKRAAKKADLLTTVSAFAQHSIARHFEMSTEKIKIIPNGIHPRFFEHHNKMECKIEVKLKFGFDKYLLYVSRIEKRKNHLQLLKAFVETGLYKENYSLVLVGHRSAAVPELDRYLSTIPSEKIRSIIFIDQVDEENLLLLYRGADLFVYPSKAEGFGIPPLEAGATGVPVVCSNTTAMEEYRFFNLNHIDPYAAEEWKTCLRTTELKQKENELQRVSAHIQSVYSWEKAAEKFYESILEKLTSTASALTKEKSIAFRTQKKLLPTPMPGSTIQNIIN